MFHDTKLNNREAVRGAICALSRESEEGYSSKPVHINKIDYLGRKFGLNVPAKDVLEELHIVGEVCNLTSGYWLPSPLRLISLGGWDLIISANPTYILENHLKWKIYITGIGRFCKKQQNRLPYQSFNDWSRIPNDLIKWTTNKLNIAKTRTIPLTINASNCVVYCPWLLKEIDASTPKNKYWKSLNALVIPDKIPCILFKEKISPHFTRSGVLFMEKGKIKSMYEGISQYTKGDRDRFMCGLDILYNIKKKYTIINKDQEKITIRLVRPLPQEERNLFVTIGRENPNYSCEYSFLNFLYPVAENTLLGLGYEKNT